MCFPFPKFVIVVPDDDLSVMYYFRFFNDEKTAVWISSVTGLTTKLGLEIWMVNSGSVSMHCHYSDHFHNYLS